MNEEEEDEEDNARIAPSRAEEGLVLFAADEGLAKERFVYEDFSIAQPC